MTDKLSTWQEEFSSLGKNNKEKSSQKLSLKRWDVETLKGERPKASSLRPTRTEKQQKAFEEKEETPKEENNKEWGRGQPPILLTQLWF